MVFPTHREISTGDLCFPSPDEDLSLFQPVETDFWELEVLSGCKQSKWEDMKRECTKKQDGGCVTPKGRVNSDPESRAFIGQAIQFGQYMPDDFLVNFTMEDNSHVPHNKAEMIALGLWTATWVNTYHEYLQSLRSVIFRCRTKEEVEEITWAQD
jgi:hypothetical protein